MFIFDKQNTIMNLFSTARLRIDFASTKDGAFLFKLMNDDTYINNIGDRNIRTIGDAETFIKEKFLKSYEENGYGYYIIKLKDNLKPIGITGIVNRVEMNFIDIGYALLPKYTNKGFAFEATQGLYIYAKQTLKISNIVAIVDPLNYRSIGLIKKLGMQFKKEVQLPEDDILCHLYSDESKVNTTCIGKM